MNIPKGNKEKTVVFHISVLHKDKKTVVFNISVLHKDKFKEKQKQIKSVFAEPKDDKNTNVELNDANLMHMRRTNKK